MREYGAFEAKTHFSELLASVSQGKSYIITKHGTKVALLIPFSEEIAETPVDEAIRAIKNLRKGILLGERLTIKKLRAEGRR